MGGDPRKKRAHRCQRRERKVRGQVALKRLSDAVLQVPGSRLQASQFGVAESQTQPDLQS